MSASRLSRHLVAFRYKQRLTNLTSSTLLPFLYETDTIRGFSNSSIIDAPGQQPRHRTKEQWTSGGYLPFDNVETTSERGNNSLKDDNGKSSLSDAERKTFAKLFGKLGTPDQQTNATTKELDNSQSRRVTRTVPRISPEQRDATLAQLPPSIRSLAEAALERLTGVPAQSADQASKEVANDAAQIAAREKQEAEEAALEQYLDGIEALLNAEETDSGAWTVLKRELFDPLKFLELDGKSNRQGGKHSKQRKASKGTSNASPEMVLAAVPHVAMLAVENIHRRFPASPLPLSILPQLKQISRTAHALALSPDIYASLMLIDWARSASPSSTISTLREMEAEGVELDREVLAAISTISEKAQAMRAGTYGRAIELICSMEGWGEKADEITRNWVPLVKQRILDAAVKQVREQEEQVLRASEASLRDGVTQPDTSVTREDEFKPDGDARTRM